MHLEKKFICSLGNCVLFTLILRFLNTKKKTVISNWIILTDEKYTKIQLFQIWNLKPSFFILLVLFLFLFLFYFYFYFYFIFSTLPPFIKLFATPFSIYNLDLSAADRDIKLQKWQLSSTKGLPLNMGKSIIQEFIKVWSSFFENDLNSSWTFSKRLKQNDLQTDLITFQRYYILLELHKKKIL